MLSICRDREDNTQFTTNQHHITNTVTLGCLSITTLLHIRIYSNMLRKCWERKERKERKKKAQQSGKFFHR